MAKWNPGEVNIDHQPPYPLSPSLRGKTSAELQLAHEYEMINSVGSLLNKQYQKLNYISLQ